VLTEISKIPPRIPPKQKEEQMENSSPNPSFSICDIRIQKRLAVCFGKTESAFRPATLPEYLEGRTPKEKHPFLFQKKFHPRQIRNTRSVFSFGVAEALRGGGGAIHSRSKKVRANARITPLNVKRICLAADF